MSSSLSGRKDNGLSTAYGVYKRAVGVVCIFAVYWAIRADTSGAQAVLSISACVVRAS